MKNWMKSSFLSEPRKNIKVKPIESYNPSQRYQNDIVFFLPNFVWD